MKKIKKTTKKTSKHVGTDFVGHLWQESWTYIKTVVDVVREPILILDQDLRVMTANESFYRMFQVEPKNTFFKGFEVAHEFPSIGRKVMILNARQIHPKEDKVSGIFPPIILLAIEDVSDMMVIAETLAGHVNQLEAKHTDRTKKLEIHIGKLHKEISKLKKRP